MGATYTRQSESAIATGEVIQASHSEDEFDQLVLAFTADSGHSHDGTAGEGGDVTKLLGTAITIGDGTAGTDIAVTFDGETNDGVLTWMEDEDYFKFSDDLLINSTEKVQFGDTATFIHQSSDGVMTIDGEATIDLNASTAVLVSNDLKLDSDASVLGFGVNNDVTLTHVHDTGILLNSTMAIQFNDASQYINAPSATVLDINATDEVEVNATLMDVNANLDVSGTYTGAGLMTTGGSVVIPNAGNIGSVSDTDAMAISSTGVVTFTQVPVLPSDTIETADIQDNAVTLAKMAGLARGKIIYGDSSGDPAALTVGSANTVLQSDGTDATWATVTNAMLAGSIADSKLSTISTADKVSAAAIQVDGATDGTSITIASTDKFLIDDAGTTKYITVDQLDSYITLSDVCADEVSAGDTSSSFTTTSGTITIDSQASTTTIDGHTGVTVQSTNSGDVTLDSIADIVLDAGGADIKLKDDGTQFGNLKNNSGELRITSSSSDTTAITCTGANVAVAGTLTTAGSEVSTVGNTTALAIALG